MGVGVQHGSPQVGQAQPPVGAPHFHADKIAGIGHNVDGIGWTAHDFVIRGQGGNLMDDAVGDHGVDVGGDGGHGQP